MPKPVLGPVAVGDRLLVIPANYHRRTSEPILAKVTKAARIWIELAEVTDAIGARSWRLRLDTQDNGSDGNYRDRFVTPEQYAWEQEMAAARAVLDIAKVRPDPGSPWREEDRLLALAEFIRQYDEQHP